MKNQHDLKNGNKVIKAAVFGSLAGASMGLLFAPKRGAELRQDIVGQTSKIGDKALEIRKKAQSTWHNVEDKTLITVNTGKSWIQKGKQWVSNFKTLVCEIRNGALTKTCSVTAVEDEAKENDDPIIEIIEI